MKAAIMALMAILAVGSGPAAVAQTAQAPPHGTTAYPWIQPPPEFKEMQRQGFHAGVKAAREDYQHHRKADYQRKRRYRHPHVGRKSRADFRMGFRRGYDDAMRDMERQGTGTRDQGAGSRDQGSGSGER